MPIYAIVALTTFFVLLVIVSLLYIYTDDFADEDDFPSILMTIMGFSIVWPTVFVFAACYAPYRLWKYVVTKLHKNRKLRQWKSNTEPYKSNGEKE